MVIILYQNTSGYFRFNRVIANLHLEQSKQDSFAHWVDTENPDTLDMQYINRKTTLNKTKPTINIIKAIL